MIVAGNIIDKYGEKLIDLPNVEYLGYVSQHILFDRIKNCSGIFSLYDPNLDINRIAASNKLYDGLMLGVPIITNSEIVAANFVEENKIGITLPFIYNQEWSKIIDLKETDILEMGLKGRKLYEERFSYEKNYIQNLDYLLENLCIKNF